MNLHFPKLFFLFLLPICANGQFNYVFDQSIPVEVEGRQLELPWAGGLNAAQFNTIDLDGDGENDVVIYDRTANVILPFLIKNGGYNFSPEYAALFPPEVSGWMLLRDFNCDGKKDIFTSDPFGIRVFKNVMAPNQNLAWQDMGILLTEGLSGQINLKVNADDIPSISDIDGDGDLDILNVRFVGIGTLEWHKNLSMEQNGNCETLVFERITQRYGEVEECGCGSFAFNGESCEDFSGRVEHAGGKALLSFDMDDDGDQELLFSEENCQALFWFENVGTKDDALFASAALFTQSSPAIMINHPAAFLEDVDFDGLPDMVVSPNLYARTNLNVDFNHSVWYYKNIGTNTVPEFALMENNFLQGEMIDVGDYGVPAFFDYDADGDQDMFIGAYADPGFFGKIYHFENTGTVYTPQFTFVTDDFASLRASQSVLQIPRMYNMKPQFVDMDADGNIDLAFTSTGQNGVTRLRYLSGKNDGSGFQSDLKEINFNIGFGENLIVHDINADGVLDILVGRANGSVSYYQNEGFAGTYDNLTLKTESFLGLGSSTLRHNLSFAIGDLNADGLEDLIAGDQKGMLTIFEDFRSFNGEPEPVRTSNSITQEDESINLGGRVWPVVVNLFNTDKPAIVVGNLLGGVHVLRNEQGQELPDEPNVLLWPNPLQHGDTLKIKSDRDAEVQIFSIAGQKMTEPFLVPAYQNYPIPIHGISSGIYIARFRSKGKVYSRRFLIL